MALAQFIETTRAANTSPYMTLVNLASSQVFSAYGGRYCKRDTSGNAVLAGAGDTALTWWVDTRWTPDHNGTTASSNTTPYTGSASAGVSVVDATDQIHDVQDAYYIPSADTLDITMVGLICDLIIAGSGATTVQKLKPTVTTDLVVKILAVDVPNQIAKVYAVK